MKWRERSFESILDKILADGPIAGTRRHRPKASHRPASESSAPKAELPKSSRHAAGIWSTMESKLATAELRQGVA